MASFFGDILALAPTAFWKLNEASGAIAADSSGNGRDGTYVNGPTLAQTSIIPNTSDTSVQFPGNFGGGAAAYVNRDNGAGAVPDLTDSFTFLAVVNLDGFDSQREMMGKIESAQVWIETTGFLTFYCTPAWTALVSTVSLTAATRYLIGARKNPTHLSIWIDGVKRGEVAHTDTPSAGSQLRFATSSSAPRYMRGRGQGFAFWHATAISDADMLSLYTSSQQIPDEPPTTPGAFTNPVGAQVVDASTVVAWGASTDPEGHAINYVGQYTVDGVAWLSLFTSQAGLTYNWNTSALAYTALAQVRVQATGSGGASAWRTSAVFTIQHVSNLPVAVLTAPVITDYSVLLANTFVDPDAGLNGQHLATQVQLDIAAGDFSVPKVDTGWVTDSVKLLRRWLTGLPPNTALKARCRVRDKGGQIGVWSAVLSFTSRRVLALGGLAGFNQNRNEGTAGAAIVATYGENVFGAGFTANYPDLRPGILGAPFDESGVRLRWLNTQGLYTQMAAPGGGSNCIRYGGAPLTPAGPISFVLVLHPEYFDPAAKSLLFGSEMWWLYRDALIVKAYGGSIGADAGVDPFLSVGALLNHQPNLLIGTYKYEQAAGGCETFPNAEVAVPGKFVLWLNGTKASIGTLDGAAMFPYTTTSTACPDNMSQIVFRDMGFGPGGAPHNFLWLGTQSSDGARDINSSNYNSYAGGFVEFAWWTNRLFSDADEAALRAAYNTSRAAFRAAVLALSPVLYDRQMQPHQPGKPILEAGLV